MEKKILLFINNNKKILLKLNLLLVLIIAFVMVLFSHKSIANVQPMSYQNSKVVYVSNVGNDSNVGTIDEPFKSLAKAIESVGHDAIINIREGIYRIDKTILLSSNNKNIVIKPYNDEEVIFTTAYSFQLDEFQEISVTDRNVIINEQAKEKVLCIDLKQKGVTNFGEIFIFDHGYDTNPLQPSLFMDNQSMILARYPNDDFLGIQEVISPGISMYDDYYLKGIFPSISEIADNQKFKIIMSNERYKKWNNSKDIWAFGYWKQDWAAGNIGIEINQNNSIITSKYPVSFGVGKNGRFYVYNLLEEIDVPGEWYLDRESGKLYIYPLNANSKNSVVSFTTFNEPLIKAIGSSNITIYDIKFRNSSGEGILGVNVNNFVVDNCEFYNLSEQAIELREAKNSIVKNSYIHDVGEGGVRIVGGNRINLISGNNYILNNKVERFAQIKTTYNAGVYIGGVGNTASHNVVNDTPHLAIGMSGNNHIIEYNEIYDVCKETSDAGALYVWRDWGARGNIVRYNYFHDIKRTEVSEPSRIYAIYLDEMFSSMNIYNNVFYNIKGPDNHRDRAGAAIFGGGRYNKFTNNVLIDTGSGLYADARGMYTSSTGENSDIRKNLINLNYQSDIWKNFYPELTTILEDEPQKPKYNTIKGNISYNTPNNELAQEVVEYGDVQDNISFETTDIFVDYHNKDFTIVLDKVNLKVPNFTQIPFASIGQYVTTKPVFENKLDQEKPSIPKISSVTHEMIVVETVAGYEYKINDNSWNSSGIFEGLEPNTTYNIYARKAETNYYNASLSSNPLAVTTNKKDVVTQNVTYFAENGTNNTVVIKVLKGTKITLNKCEFTPPKYKIFKSWLINGVEYLPGDVYSVEKDVSIKAIWKDIDVDFKFTQDSSEIYVADKIDLKTLLKSSLNEIKISWKTSNEKIALVDNNGVVTAKSEGKVVVTASIVVNNKVYNASYNLLINNVPVSEIMLNKSNIKINNGTKLTLIPFITPENATNKNIIWSSSNSNVVSVDNNGVILAKKAGVVQITATTIDGNKKASCEVVVIDTSDDKLSSNNLLANLEIPGIKLNFSSDIFDYSVIVDYNVREIEIISNLMDNKASYILEYGNRKVNLNVGENLILIKTIAENGAENEYRLNIFREKTILVKNILIDNYNFYFDPNNKTYKLNISNETELNFIVNLNDENFKYEIYGNKDLVDGDSIIIKAFSDDLEETYEFLITKKNNEEKSDTKSIIDEIFIIVSILLIILIIYLCIKKKKKKKLSF